MKAKAGKTKVGQIPDRKPPKGDGPRALLLETGKSHFLKHGAKGISVRKIASEAGVNLGSFVYYFETKENFVREIILEFIRSNEKFLDDISDPDREAELSIEDLKLLVFNFLSMSPESNRFVLRMLTDALEGEYGVLDAILNDPPQQFIAIRKTIVAAQVKKQLRKDIAPEFIHLLLLLSLGLPQFAFSKMYVETKSEKTKKMISKFLGEDSLKVRIEFMLKSLEPEK